MKQVLMINLASFSDVITNSSSELFVIKDANKSKAEIETLLNATYPKWANEYDSPLSIDELDKDDLDWLYSLILPSESRCYNPDEALVDYRLAGYTPEIILKKFLHNWKRNKYNTWYSKIAATLGVDPNEFWCEFKNWKPYIAEYKYNNRTDRFVTITPYLRLTILGEKAVRNYFKNSWFLYSIDENPNWEGQEALSEIAYRIHMG